MKIKNRNVWVFDNRNTPNETADYFTIVLGNGDLLAANSSPFFPTGIGMHSGNLVDNIMFIKYGVGWRKHCRVKAVILEEVQNFLTEARYNPNWLGNEITDIKSLSDDVVKFITQNL